MAVGEYSIKNIPIGTYSVTASKPGHATQKTTITVSEDELTLLDFQLTEKPPTPNLFYIFAAIIILALLCLIMMYRK